MAKLMITESELNGLIRKELIRSGLINEDGTPNKFLHMKKHGFLGSFINNALANDFNWEKDQGLKGYFENLKNKDNSTDSDTTSSSSKSDNTSKSFNKSSGKYVPNSNYKTKGVMIGFSLDSLLINLDKGDLKFANTGLSSEIRKETRDNKVYTPRDFDNMLLDKTRNGYDAKSLNLYYTVTDERLKPKSYLIGIKSAIDNLCDKYNLTKTKSFYSDFFKELSYLRNVSDLKKAFGDSTVYTLLKT